MPKGQHPAENRNVENSDEKGDGNMILQNLSVGAEVLLEVVWGENRYEITTKVTAVQPDHILIMPFSYKGTVLDLGKNQFRDMMYNLYAYDTDAGGRFVWKNIQIETKKIRGKSYYEIRVNSFGRYGVACERREDERMLIDVAGNVKVGENMPFKRVEIHDISNGGISFFSGEDIETAGEKVYIDFEDRVHGHYFHLVMECICVRRKPVNNGFLYGCQVQNAPKNVLVYACLKKMESKNQADGE